MADITLDILTQIFVRLDGKLDWNKKSSWSLQHQANSIRRKLDSMVRHGKNVPLTDCMEKRIEALLKHLNEVDIFVLKYQIMSLGKKVRHVGKHRDLLADFESNLTQTCDELFVEYELREGRKIRESSNAINVVAELRWLALAAKTQATQESAEVYRTFFNKVCEKLNPDSRDESAEDTRTERYKKWTLVKGSPPQNLPLAEFCKQKFKELQYDDKGNFCGCIHCYDSENRSKNQQSTSDHTCSNCNTALKRHTKSRARWQKGFRGFELVSVVASAVMMLSWVWPRPYGVHKMQPWATRHDKELWLSISAGLATFFALLSFGKQIMSPIGVHANLGQTKWKYAVAWAVGDLLTAISGIVTIMLIFQHQLFEQDLGEPDSTPFLVLSCMYGFDVVYQLVFLTVLCMGCSSCTGHSNGKKPDKSETAQDEEKALLSGQC